MKKDTQRTILIGTSEPNELRQLADILALSGCAVVTVNRGDKVLGKACTEGADLVLLDVGMTAVSGFEVCRLLKEDSRTRHIPVIFINKANKTDDKRKGFLVGGADYISAPFIPEEILARIKMHLLPCPELDVKANEFSRKNEEIYIELFDNAPVGYHEVDAEGRIVRINRTELEMLGYSHSEVIGRFFWMFAADEPSVQQMIIAKLSGEAVQTEPYECDFRCKDGTIVSVLISDKLLATENGPITGIRCTVQDITGRKRMEKELQESEERLKFALGGTNDGVWDVNMETNGVYLSPRGCEILGYEPERLQDVVSVWSQLVHPDDIAETNAALSAYLAGKTPIFTVEQRLKMASGEWKWIHTRGKVVSYNQDNQPLRMVGTHTDITDRKLAQEALKQSEEKFKKVFLTSPNCLNINRLKDGMYVALNPGFTEIIGYTEDETLGKTSIEMNIWCDLEDRKKWADELSRTGKVRNFETQFRTKSGDTIYAIVSASIIELNGVEHVLSVTSDITQRKIAEKALKDSEQKFRNIFEYSVAGKSITGFDGRLRVNKAFCNIVGYTKDELNRLTWREITYPDDIAFKQREIELLLKGIKRFSSFESRFVHKNGSTVWVDLRTVLQKDDAGKPLYFFTSIIDITERKLAEMALRESEEKLSTLFGSLTELVVMNELVFDADGKSPVNYRIVDCNEAYTRITGIKKEDAIGRLATEVYEIDRLEHFEIYVQVATTGKAYEYDTYYAPLDKHFIVSVVSPRINTFAVITTDISAIKQVQAEITAKNKELENYLYVASHDLRSPLVNIQGFSQRLQKQSDEIKSLLESCTLKKETRERIDRITDESVPRTLNFILSNVLKMDSLINSLLHISRTGRLPLEVRKVNMNKLLNAIVATQNYQITEQQVQVTIHELPDCYGDENQLNQLFSNIVDNAIKYRDKNRTLAIEIDSKVHFDKKIIYSIKDTGLGISVRNMERIWDVFYRVDSTATAGEGIGLSIAKTIAAKHKGKIWVDSEEGVGSIFNVELPVPDFLEQ